MRGCDSTRLASTLPLLRWQKSDGEKEIHQNWLKMETKYGEPKKRRASGLHEPTFLTHGSIHHSLGLETLFLEPGFLPGKKLGNFGWWSASCLKLKLDTIISSQISNHLNGLIPWFFAVLATIHATFCFKSSEKKHVPKTRFRLVKSNSPELEMGGSARPGTKSLGYGSEWITQFISSISTRYIWVICLQFIYITSSITILNRYDIPIIYLYLYHSIYYDNRYVCIIKCIYETYTDILLFAVSISFLPIQCHILYWTQWPSCHCHWKILR